MSVNRNLFVFVALLSALILSACTFNTAQQPTEPTLQTDLVFINHPAGQMPEQDVFVELEPGSDLVQRLSADQIDAYLDTPVFASTQRIEHDPFQLGDEPLGPYQKGLPLGFTMGDWLAGSASGTYTVSGDQAEIELQFDNLVPNGVYTIWCAHINVPPNFTIVDEPCGAQDGSENIVVADAEGKAQFNLTQAKMPDATDETAQVIAAAYHSDGQTYGFYPGRFGQDTHVQILAFIPAPGDAAWQVVSDDNSLAKR